MTVATYAAAQILRVLPRERITRAVGRLCDLRLPPPVCRAVVGLYVRAYDVDLDEAEPPQGTFDSFDEFFTRRLRSGRRPMCADPEALVSPSDGRVVALGRVDAEGALMVKGRPYRIEELVGDEDDARRYHGGQFVVIYLSPRDYHRVHSPVSGAVTLVRSLPGDLYPVNAIGERHVARLLSRNRRVAIVIDTDAGHRVTVVMVSAMIVGRVTVSGIGDRDVPFGLHEMRPPARVARGDEIGIFHLGSTAVVFVEPNVAPTLDHVIGSVRMGEPLHGSRVNGVEPRGVETTGAGPTNGGAE